MYRYNHPLGEIVDAEDGQIIATMSGSATPEQGTLLAAAPQMQKALELLIEAVTHHQADLRYALGCARDAVEAAKDLS